MNYVVKDLIPKSSVNIAVGDSGLGKSPFFYQMALCVSAGKPFLGREVERGKVIILDFENGVTDIVTLCKRLAQHLGIDSLPDDLLIWTWGSGGKPEVEDMIEEHRPVLVVADSLRAYRPDVEEKNSVAGPFLTDHKEMAIKYGTAFNLIHHIKKPNEQNGVRSLRTEPVMTWLLQACGARALINQTDIRIGFDAVQRFGSKVPTGEAGPVGEQEAALVLKGFARLRGEIGPLYLAREFDQDGEPLGYRLLKGSELLFNTEQQKCFTELADEFSFKEAKQEYSRQDQATSDFLNKCVGFGILLKVGRGRWEKVSCNGAE